MLACASRVCLSLVVNALTLSVVGGCAKTVCLLVVAVALSVAVASCGGDSVKRVSPTPRSAFRSTYPCELLTRSVAARVLSIKRLRRIGAQTLTLGGGTQQCIWARGRYKMTPQLGLAIFATEGLYDGVTVAELQRRYERLPRLPGRHRRLDGVGERALLFSSGRDQSSIVVAQDGRSWQLTLRLKQKPRSQPPPLGALEGVARMISARFDASRIP